MLGYRYGWIALAGLFFLLVFVCWMSPMVIRGSVKREGDDDHAELTVKALLGLIHYHWELPVMRLKEAGLTFKREQTAENLGGSDSGSTQASFNLDTFIQSFEKLKPLLKHKNSLLDWAKKTLAHVRLTECRWRTVVGTDDAVWTAMATGMVWSVKTTAVGAASQFMRMMTEPELSVEPDYGKTSFSIEGAVTLKIGLGYAIFAGIAFMVRMKKALGLKQGLFGWQRILMRA
ncbi:DUF2953 domain-containing protein [Paenibacillus humicola]|uniref:DUF2953 domain-containing protein n=1 Tax=Paenibacillus humicola TaxID=3110540 RepID=UPI00237B7F06|nr:DUF2953 domain-containing protein [Paenibacillus humicola]